MQLQTGGRWNWFSELSAAAAEAVAECCEPIRFAAGESIYRRGEPTGALFQVVEGRVQLRRYASSGKELLYIHMDPGDCFGELGLIDHGPYFHDADAARATMLLRLARPAFLALRREYPEIDQLLLQLLARRNRTIYEIVEGALLLDVPHRLAGRLRNLFPEDPGAEPEIACSHEDLAKMIGSSRQSVTGTLKAWEREGWLRQSYGKIRLLDPAGLEAYLDD